MYRFMWKPKWILSHLLVLALIIAMINLMFWQLRRLDEKKQLNALMAKRADGTPAQLVDVLDRERVTTVGDGDRVEYQAVVTTGRYDTSKEFTIPNRTLDGAPGRLVVTPLRFADGRPDILVVRGFIPQAIQDDTPPIEGAVPPDGEVQVRGWLRVAELPGALQPEKVDLGNNRMARMDIDRIEAARHMDLEPVYLQLGGQSPATPGKALSLYPLPERSEGPHFSYAVQWGIFTLIAIGGYPLVLRRVARGGGRHGDDLPDDDRSDRDLGDGDPPDDDPVPAGASSASAASPSASELASEPS